MSTIDEMKADFNLFLNDPFFSESVTVTPDGGAAAIVQAVVYRPGGKVRPMHNTMGSGSQAMMFDYSVAIMKDATDGIATVALGTTKITLPKTWGGTDTVDFRVKAIIRHDPAVWYLGLAS